MPNLFRCFKSSPTLARREGYGNLALIRTPGNHARDGRFDELEEPYPATAEAMAEASDEVARHARAPSQSAGSVGSDGRFVKCCRAWSAPAERRGDMGQDRLDDMRIVGDAKLVRDRQE